MQKDLKRIKGKYGEKFSHLCRELFPTLLETEGLLSGLLESKFYPSKFLYYDIVNNELVSSFQDFINKQFDKKDDNVEINTDKVPYELLNEVGYTLYKCNTEDDIQKFKKFYKSEETLCTFNGNRLKTDYVFFAVKKNVDDIKREDFPNPERQDEYGTSVISIQFAKGNSNYVSIKNRYNHTVDNPDSTFGNNLDNIIGGLTNSFKNTYGFNICNKTEQEFEIPNYVLAADGKFYKYNYEINNIYYCPDNIIIKNFKPQMFEKDRYIIFDYFILDMKEKTISLYDNNIKDSFTYYSSNIEKIEIKKEKDKKYILLEQANHQVVIVLDMENKMIAYHNDLVMKIDDDFLNRNKYLEAIYLDNVVQINNCFMQSNNNLKYLWMPLLKKCGDCFLYYNEKLKEITFPNLEYIGDKFIYWNNIINKVNLPMLKKVGDGFVTTNRQLEYLKLPSITKIGDGFISENAIINFFYAPYLEEVGSEFLTYNNSLTFLELPNLKGFKSFFLQHNKCLKELKLPNLEEIGKFYLNKNTVLDTLEISETISNSFIYNSSFKNNFRTHQKKLTLFKN